MHRDYDFERLFTKQIPKQYLLIASVFGHYWNRLQANMCCFRFEIASIFALNRFFHCKHIWSPSLILLQPYVVHDGPSIPYAYAMTYYSYMIRHIWYIHICEPLLYKWVVYDFLPGYFAIHSNQYYIHNQGV